MELDRVLGDRNLYIGGYGCGLFTLKRKEALKNANITHVLSVLTLPLDEALFKGYERLVVDIDDLEDEDIIQHFPASNAFIKAGLESRGGVLVHCAMGKSRSATLLLAYHLSTQHAADPTTALMLLRQGRPMAEPNPGFMDQLHLYHRMRCPANVAAHPLYQRWCYKRVVKRSKAAAQAPGSEFIVFEDETEGTPAPEEGAKPEWKIKGGAEVAKRAEGENEKEEEEEEYRCRRCRTQLGGSTYLVPHTPLNVNASSNNKKKRPTSSPTTPQPCAHLFLHPLSWMRPILSRGELDGRLECPNARCGQNVGKYAWQGMRCSCGEWVVPGISVARGKVDVIAVSGRKKAVTAEEDV
ncbi:MAG: hypothetical protein LQ341_004936 [Variospora aurantia]|nr:MAG: hypothetical protein LQ341_004936 [Variospora aurantia]